MHKQRLGVVVAAGLGVIGVFLSWATITIPFFGSTSVNGTQGGDGWLVFLLCAGAGALAFIGDRENPIDAGKVKE